jgi:hypothetical protein
MTVVSYRWFVEEFPPIYNEDEEALPNPSLGVHSFFCIAQTITTRATSLESISC